LYVADSVDGGGDGEYSVSYLPAEDVLDLE
jgi:hypothetical protein